MPKLVRYQTMVILDPNGMTFDTVGVFGLVYQLLFKSDSSYCVFNATLFGHYFQVNLPLINMLWLELLNSSIGTFSGHKL